MQCLKRCRKGSLLFHLHFLTRDALFASKNDLREANAGVFGLRVRRYQSNGASGHHKGEASPRYSPETLKLGDKFCSSRRFSKEDVLLFAHLCKDANPIHTQDLAAKESGFPGCVVNGMLHAGIFPAIIGSQFPGAIYVSQTLNFREPVFVDEDLFAEVVVKELMNLKKFYKVTFATACYKKVANILVLDGNAVALIPTEKLRS